MNIAVTSETVMSDCGSMKTRNALSYAAFPATLRSPALAPAVDAAAARFDTAM